MKEQFTTQEISLKLEKLGFKEKCLASYFVFGDGVARDGKYGQTEPELFIFGINEHHYTIDERSEELGMYAYHVVSVPLWQQVIDWLRENHKIWINSVSSHKGIFCFLVADQANLLSFGIHDIKYPSYHEAREQAVLKALELIKKEKDKKLNNNESNKKK